MSDDIEAIMARYPDSESVLATGDPWLGLAWFRGEADRLARALHKREEASQVVKFHPVVVGEGYRFNADEILEAAKDRGFTNVLIIGELPDGELWVSSAANAGEALILMRKAEKKIVFPD